MTDTPDAPFRAARVVAATAPIAVEVKVGETYWWCSCGRSKAQPFCDGSHAGTGHVPLEYQPPRDRTVWMCCCKATKKPPLCDGSHSALPAA